MVEKSKVLNVPAEQVDVISDVDPEIEEFAKELVSKRNNRKSRRVIVKRTDIDGKEIDTPFVFNHLDAKENLEARAYALLERALTGLLDKDNLTPVDLKLIPVYVDATCKLRRLDLERDRMDVKEEKQMSRAEAMDFIIAWTRKNEKKLKEIVKDVEEANE